MSDIAHLSIAASELPSMCATVAPETWLALLPAVVAPLSPAERNQFVLDMLAVLDKAGVEVAGCAIDCVAAMVEGRE